MPTESTEDLLARAFAAGASSISIRSRAPYFDDYEADVAAYEERRDDAGRCLSQMASAKALAAAIDKVAKVEASAIEARAQEARYAIAGRPGVFVTRSELRGSADRVEQTKLEAAEAATAVDEATG